MPKSNINNDTNVILSESERRKKAAIRENLSAYSFIAPAIIFISIFLFYPLIYTIVLSFSDYNAIKGEISGFTMSNYANLLSDSELGKVLINTLVFILGTVPVTVIISLFLAVLLNKNIKFKGGFRTIFFLPNITSFAAAGVIFIWMLNPDADRGLVNFFLNKIGISSVNWLQSKPWAMISVMALTVWKNIGYFMVIYLAGLQDIPKSVYEAADIDGANVWQQFKNVTLPLLKPTTVFVVMMDLIFTFRTFEQVYIMTKGGPVLSTKVLVYYIYEKAFVNFDMAYAAAVSMVLLLIVAIITIVQNKVVSDEADTARD